MRPLSYSPAIAGIAYLKRKGVAVEPLSLRGGNVMFRRTLSNASCAISTNYASDIAMPAGGRHPAGDPQPALRINMIDHVSRNWTQRRRHTWQLSN